MRKILAAIAATSAAFLALEVSSLRGVKKIDYSKVNTTLASGFMPINETKAQNSQKALLALEKKYSSIKNDKPKLPLLPLDEKTIERLKNRLKDARGKKIVEGVNFSKMDLRDFDLNNLDFKDCNFSGAKFPSLDSVAFYNSCNLENADFSDIVLTKVHFGDKSYQNQVSQLASLIGKNQLLMNNITEFDENQQALYFKELKTNSTLGEMQSDIIKLTEQTQLKPEILRIKANFAGAEFNNFWAYNADFSGSDFENTEIKINHLNNIDDKASIYVSSVTGLDLTNAIFKFYDIKNREVQKTHGTQQLNLKSNEGLEMIGNSGIVSKEYLREWRSDKKVRILLNFDQDEIPPDLKIQNDYKSYKSLKAPQNTNDIEAKGVELCNQFFGRYNIEFVTNEMSEAKEVDYKLHFNFVNLNGHSALTSFSNYFGLGNRDHVINMNTDIIKGDFWSVFLHEMTHMFLQDPVRQSDLFYPAKISYLQPMAKHPDKTGKFGAKNILPIQEPSIVEQELIQKYMGLFGRKPKITADLTSKYYPKNLGMTTSYNPDKNFNNIVEISSKDFNDENHIIIMNGENALGYCATSDPYKCHPAKGLEKSQAILTMNKKTGTVLSMIMLGGENPKIKIDGKLFDVKDLTEKDIFSFIAKDSQGNIVYYKYKGLSFIESNSLVKANETLVKQDEEGPQKKPKSTTENLVASNLVNDPKNLEKKSQPHL